VFFSSGIFFAGYAFLPAAYIFIIFPFMDIFVYLYSLCMQARSVTVSFISSFFLFVLFVLHRHFRSGIPF